MELPSSSPEPTSALFHPTGACGIFWDNTCTHQETQRIFNFFSDSLWPFETRRPWGDVQKEVTSTLKLASSKDMGKDF